MPEVEIHYIAVLAAGVATFMLGGLWYSPLLFAKPWMKAHGYDEENAKDLHAKAGRAYAVSAVCYVVMAFVIAVLVGYTGTSTAWQGVKLGFLLWVGIAAVVGLTGNMFSDKPIGVWLIDAGYQLAYLVLMSVMLTLWK